MKTTPNSHCKQTLIRRSAQIIAGLGLIGSGLVASPVALTASSFVIPDLPNNSSTVVPGTPASPKKPAKRLPAAPQTVAPKPAAPPSISKPFKAPAPKSSSQPSTVFQVKPTTPAQQPLSAPNISRPPIMPSAKSNATTPQVQPGKNQFIDTASYGNLEKSGYTAPSKVVLTERSSGCQTVSQNGKLLLGSCGNVAKTPSGTVAKTQKTASAKRPLARSSTVKPLRPVRSKSETRNFSPSPVVPIPAAKQTGLSIAIAPLSSASGTGQASAFKLPVPQGTSLIYPLAIPARISSVFGWRVHPISGQTRMHTGTDIAAPTGTPVLATYPGQVTAAGWQGGYGLMVTLAHEEATQESRYAHLSEIYVRPGQWVEQGTVIGRVGNTGFSTGPHLHFEWRHKTQEGWVAVDAGLHLEYALDNLERALQFAQSTNSSARNQPVF